MVGRWILFSHAPYLGDHVGVDITVGAQRCRRVAHVIKMDLLAAYTQTSKGMSGRESKHTLTLHMIPGRPPPAASENGQHIEAHTYRLKHPSPVLNSH